MDLQAIKRFVANEKNCTNSKRKGRVYIYSTVNNKGDVDSRLQV